MQPSNSPDLRRILIVDDSREVAHCVSMMLSFMGFETLSVHTARAGIDAHEQACAEGQPFCLLILDWEMPVTTGLEVAQTVRARGDAVKIVFLSAYFEEITKKSIKAVGAELWAKPIDIATLTENVQRVLADQP